MSGGEPTLHLFDDRTARAWEPFALTRPVAELLFGTFRMRERAERVLGLRCPSVVAGPALEGFREPWGVPAVTREGPGRSNRRVLLCSRVVAEGPLPEGWDAPEGATLVVEEQVMGWVLPPGVGLPPEEALLDPESARPGRILTLRGRVLRHPWELVEGNARQVGTDLRVVLPPPAHVPALSPGVHVLGRHSVTVAPGVEVEPGVVLDAREGPIRLETGVVVRAFTRLEGPAWIGAGTILLGGVFTHISAGPRCRLRGEVEASVILGWSNKAHDGYLGHAYLGSWVNLGAMTTNSDLKNNYGNVRIRTLQGEVDTGLMKVGCFLGDHVKTGIGTLLNTGTVVGAGSNLFGGAMPPLRVPPFSWGSGSELTTYRLDRFLETAERAMGRRNVPLSPEMREVLTRAFYGTEGERGAREGRGDTGGGPNPSTAWGGP